MELKAQYDLDDLLDLVEQDLEAKGFRLMGGFSPVINGREGLLLTLAIEQLETKAIATAFKSPLYPAPTPAPAPAPTATVTRAAKPQVTPEEKDAKRQATLKKARGKYAEKKKAEKLATAQVTPAPFISATHDKEFQDRVLSEINELKGQSNQQQEVVAPTTSPFPVSELLSSLITTSSY